MTPAAVLGVKDDLDRLSDVLRAYSQLGWSLAGAGRERAAGHRAFTTFLDVMRLTSDDAATRRSTREDVKRRALSDTASPLHRVVSRLRTWQRAGFGGDHADVVRAAMRLSFTGVARLADAIAPKLDALPAGPPITVRDDPVAPHYDRVGPSAFVPVWVDVASRILARVSDVLAVWPSYYHLYVFVRDGADEAPETVMPIIADAVAALGTALFTTPRNVSPIARSRPLILPERALGPLLASCYLNKPFKHFDLAREPSFARVPGFGVDRREPSFELLEVMAREAACHAALTMRTEPERLESGPQVYRGFLRVLQLRLFLDARVLASPLAATPTVYREHYPADADWLARLAHDGLAGITARDLYARYYEPTRRVLDATLATMPVAS